uniref:Uncharacterized protein n=1 Tax=Ananas comosus var. bracteatus TaxID=296719 RepID=A0A6V7P5K0_ANACO|nr:unnamed protein product [Ananas comosus var. bracteatus]
MVFNPTQADGPICDRPSLIRASLFLLLPAVGQLVLITTLFDVNANARAPFLNLLVRSLLAITLALAFNVVMLVLLLPLAPFADVIAPTVASRLERAAAAGSLTTLLLATSLFVFVALIGD